MLDSVMASISLFDEVEVSVADKISVIFENVSIDPVRNTAYKTAKLVKDTYGVSLCVRIKKGLPIGGGVGGSSADSAAVLYAAEKLCGADIKKLAPRVGSDVYFMTKGGTARVSGTGDEVTPFDNKATFSALIVNCGDVSTPLCYDAYDTLGGNGAPSSEELIKELSLGNLPENLLKNDLLPGALSLNARIGEAMELLRSKGVKSALTGSGGCIFAINAEKLAPFMQSNGFECYTAHYVPRGVEEV